METRGQRSGWLTHTLPPSVGHSYCRGQGPPSLLEKDGRHLKTEREDKSEGKKKYLEVLIGDPKRTLYHIITIRSLYSRPQGCYQD